MVVNSYKESIELNNGVRIEVHTSNFRLVRGFSCVGVVCDELAFWNRENTNNPDKEILNALRPSLASTGGLLLGLSSPYAKRGVLWDEYQEHYGHDESPTLVWKAASREMNSTLSLLSVARAYARDYASASAEYGGEFRNDVETFLAIEKIEEAVVSGRTELPYQDGQSYFSFVDPSGGRDDSMTLGISHTANGKAVLDVIREVKPPFSPEQCVQDFAEDLRRYRVSEVVGDRYSGEWVREQFNRRGIVYKVSDRNRSEIYLEFLSMIMSSQVELLDSDVLKRQLSSLERRSASLGKDSVDHHSGQHDDVANAACGALILASAQGESFGFVEMLKRIGGAGGVKPWFEGIRVKEAQRVEKETPLACAKCGDRVLVQATGTHARCRFGHFTATSKPIAPAAPNDAGACNCGRNELHAIVGGGAWICRQTGRAWWPNGQAPKVTHPTRGGLRRSA
jgi:hypothetical protein